MVNLRYCVEYLLLEIVSYEVKVSKMVNLSESSMVWSERARPTWVRKEVVLLIRWPALSVEG